MTYAVSVEATDDTYVYTIYAIEDDAVTTVKTLTLKKIAEITGRQILNNVYGLQTALDYAPLIMQDES